MKMASNQEPFTIQILKRFRTFVIASVFVFGFSACSWITGLTEVPPGIEFSVSGAKAIAGYISDGYRPYSIVEPTYEADREMNAYTILSRINDDASMESVITHSDITSSWCPDVYSILIGDDKSVYICFTQPFGVSISEDSYVVMQLIRVHPDDHFEILWPLAPFQYNELTGEVSNSGFFAEGAYIQKGADGKIYFMVFRTYCDSEHASHYEVYDYDPSSGNAPVLRTPADPQWQVNSFKVDGNGHLYIHGYSSESEFLRIYTPDIVAPTNIFYSAYWDSGVTNYIPTQAGDALLIIGNDVGGLSGIIKANISGTSVTLQPMYEDNTELYGDISFDNIEKLIWGAGEALYGIYSSYFSFGADSNLNVVKLLDSAGEKDFSPVFFKHRDLYPDNIKYNNGYFYYRYSILEEGFETGCHSIARLNLALNEEEELIVDDYLNSRKLEVIAYDVSGDNSTLYISAFDYARNFVINGKIDLATKDFTISNESSIYTMIQAF